MWLQMIIFGSFIVGRILVEEATFNRLTTFVDIIPIIHQIFTIIFSIEFSIHECHHFPVKSFVAAFMFTSFLSYNLKPQCQLRSVHSLIVVTSHLLMCSFFFHSTKFFEALSSVFKFICFCHLFIVVTMRSFTFVPCFDVNVQGLF